MTSDINAQIIDSKNVNSNTLYKATGHLHHASCVTDHISSQGMIGPVSTGSHGYQNIN